MSEPADNDDLRTLSVIARSLPGSRGARWVHPASVTRWIMKGARSKSGAVVYLAATRVGSRWMVRPSDLAAFFEALAEGPVPVPPAVATPTRARKAAERAERAGRELQKRGA